MPKKKLGLCACCRSQRRTQSDCRQVQCRSRTDCVDTNVKSTCSKACDDKNTDATWMQPGIRFETVRCSHFAAFHSASALQVVRACCLKWASRKAQPLQLRIQSNQLQNYHIIIYYIRDTGSWHLMTYLFLCQPFLCEIKLSSLGFISIVQCMV